ncbi:DUF605-domain-containing protein [Nadsonia fulvescens var. elongata DSM 6958]|uniref:DUF605-domain-containing protein n=1 Tax=Nadsonia fulvescens var. elongata DSM 6958 TaxID=857566 RepID=A0A1E3PLW3_9ASCO|nr:DUF605-domain-containing protein [Nadsonia fulvescens var. elongata DSM 6958]
MAYYCKLHAVQQIISSGLHLSDPSVANYTMLLLDDIEQLKKEDSVLTSENGRAILGDEDVAKAYVENFAYKIFVKADKAVHDKTVTKQTAMAFMACATFLDLLDVFEGEVDEGNLEKKKYAKFQAMRIMKALKNGEDPNDYEPEPQDQEEFGYEDGDQNAERENGEAEIDKILNEAKQSIGQEDVEDEAEVNNKSNYDDVNINSENEAENSDSEQDYNNLFPSTPSFQPSSQPSVNETPFNSTLFEKGNVAPDLPSAPSAFSTHITPSAPIVPSAPPAPLAPSPHQALVSKETVRRIVDESQLISTVQKHAKFAISALNYEDMKTAMKELRLALELLENYNED